MAYNNRGRSNYRRSSSSSGAGSRWMALRFAGSCKVCGNGIPAGAQGYWDKSTRLVTCSAIECARADGLTRREWVGSPVSGSYVEVLAEQRIGEAAPADPFAKTRSRGYYGPGAGRCEDAPCCGCC